MKYRTMRFIGGEENVSLLGLGCMRFPLNEDGTIDEAQAEAMIGRALNAGIVSVIMGTILTLFMMVARKSLVQVFINDAQVITYGIQMVIALQLSAPFLGILFLCINTIQGMGKAIPSLLLTVCRQGLIFIPLIFILNHMFGLEGVIYAQPAADYLSIVVAILICTHLFRTMEHRNESVEA